MAIKSKKVRYSIILSSLFLIFSIWFYIHHYNLLFDSKLFITCKAINDTTNEPLEYSEIEIYRIEKPWYTMWSPREIVRGNTNGQGEFSFQISESKRYRVGISKNLKKRFIGDFQTYTGGTEFEGNEVSDGEIILIPCDNRKTGL